MEQKALYFGKNDIIKNAFHKSKKQIKLIKQMLKNGIIQ